jgi:hypothetical protein
MYERKPRHEVNNCASCLDPWLLLSKPTDLIALIQSIRGGRLSFWLDFDILVDGPVAGIDLRAQEGFVLACLIACDLRLARQFFSWHFLQLDQKRPKEGEGSEEGGGRVFDNTLLPTNHG